MNFDLTFLTEVLEMNAENVAAVVITGLVVVFSGLVLLIAFVSFLGLFFKNKDKPKVNGNVPVKTENKNNNVGPALIVEEGISDEIVAVIAAAIAAMGAKTGKKLAIRSVKNATNSNYSAWASAGRQDNTKPF